MMPSIYETMLLINHLHSKQRDKAGFPYAMHPVRVRELLRIEYPECSEDAEHAALLHDVVEDCGVKLSDLSDWGYSEATVKIVDIVSKRKDPKETYTDFIDRVIRSGNVEAIKVKIVDIHENSHPERTKYLPDVASLLRKYERALVLLTGALAKAV